MLFQLYSNVSLNILVTCLPETMCLDGIFLFLVFVVTWMRLNSIRMPIWNGELFIQYLVTLPNYRNKCDNSKGIGKGNDAIEYNPRLHSLYYRINGWTEQLYLYQIGVMKRHTNRKRPLIINGTKWHITPWKGAGLTWNESCQHSKFQNVDCMLRMSLA